MNALKKGGHSVRAFEGDRDLIDKLQDFMPGVLKGERPGMAFNLSYGVQGQARYTHVPSILEMVGIPYVGSGPLAHSLALDKVVANRGRPCARTWFSVSPVARSCTVRNEKFGLLLLVSSSSPSAAACRLLFVRKSI